MNDNVKRVINAQTLTVVLVPQQFDVYAGTFTSPSS